MPKNFVSNDNETLRMFKSDFLEVFSKVHWTVPLILFVPVVLYYLYQAIFVWHLSFLLIIGLFIAGQVSWTIAEYIIHRFIFHYQPTSKFGQKLHFIFHGVHHDYPRDSLRLVMPPILSIPLAFFFYYSFVPFMGPSILAPFFAGYVTGYLVYDIGHYAIHHFNMHGMIMLAIKNHHMRHHYQDSTKGYGVSSPIWDIIIRTNFKGKNNMSQETIEPEVELEQEV